MTTKTKNLRTTMKKLNGDSLTPILIFRRLQGKQKFLLESSSIQKGSGRYSFIGMNPVKAYRGQEGQIEELDYTNGPTYTHEGDLYKLLKRLMPRITDDVNFPFTGGAVGYVGYGAARNDEKRLEDDLEMPDVYFNIYDTVIIYDHELNEVTLLHTEINPVYGGPNLEALEEMILNGVTEKEAEVSMSPYRCKVTQQQFEDQVREAISFIDEGAAEQIVISRRLEADIQGDPFALYRKLRKSNPSPYMYFMEFEDHTVIGTSPESLVKVTGDTVMVNPIAGTRRRGKNHAEDLALEAELRKDPKELAEHEMLVALSKEEMNGMCMPETVRVSNNKETVRYEHVMHLVSEIEGTLAHGLHALDALKASSPAGTVTGSPKSVAMDIIDQLEKQHRGIYGGAIGYIGLNGNIDFALTIRTMLIKDGKAYVQAGAGVVKQSNPTDEYLETVNKAKSLLEVIQE
ncbi:chorismate-binding protein [Sporosarcina sp. Marseille-Q4063]|uniref:chorismate-binding protein n=1 Tax=Sporosarcina sp. Marseille-Q4063 TaxID=2810514 RepID=UPI001BB0193F|nr:chorismate-binding protein [Sporosarcina sp. Marseille-Q4063]QUW20580.1 chorismate-binding protein [Sporosarcina sp. Marseille-Q4063]